MTTKEEKFLDEMFQKRAAKAQVENGISRFISQFNVSIQNEDEEEQHTKKEVKKLGNK